MSVGPKDWLVKAEGDFGSACWEMQAQHVNFNAVVFHAQQCVEKLMKGVLVAASQSFARTHELNILAHQVKQIHPAWTWNPADLAALQPGAVLLRYPGYDATKEDADRAVAACSRVRESLLPFI